MRWWIAGAPLLAGCGATGVTPCGNLGGGGVNSVQPWDGGVVDGGSSANGSLDSETCQQVCPATPPSNSCLIVDAGLVECRVFCVGGRAPPGLVSLSNVDATPGSWLARMAQLEAAAVWAFVHLARELDAHGLPAFATAALKAAGEELHHATSVTGLALRHGHCPQAPVIEAREVRSLEALALDNAGEGCGREWFGSFLNVHQARTAADPEIARVMGDIAGEERAHADWSFSLAETLSPRLTLAQRRRMREAQAHTLSALGGDEASPAARTTLGLMDEAQAAATAKSLLDQRRL